MQRPLLPIAILISLLLSSTIVIAQESHSKIKKEKKEAEEREKRKEKEGEKEERKFEEENDEYDGPDKAAAFEFQRTKDPTTGKVPREKIIAAIEMTKKSKENAALRNLSSRSTITTWVERGPNSDVVGSSNGNTRPNSGVASGRVRAILVDSSDATHKTIWVGGVDGGLWKTTDITTSPANWKLVNDYLSNLAITDICQNPRGNRDTMYFCTGEGYYNSDAVKGNGVFKSVDHGVTWTLLTSTISYGFCTRILCDYLGNIYLATNGNGLLRSVNGGNSWTTITPTGLSTNICDLEISSTSGIGRLHLVAGIFSTQAYRYTDISATATSSTGWNTPTTTFTSGSQRAEIACKGSVLYALPADATYEVPTIYKSTDGGTNWAATSGQPSSGWASGQGWYALSVDINTANTNQCIIGGLDAYKTTDGGATWTQISTWVGTSGQYVHADIHKILWFDGGTKLLFGCDGGVHYSSNGGSTIRDRNTGLRIKQSYSCAIHPSTTNFLLGGAQDNGTHLLTGAGLSSSTEVTGGDGAFVAIDQDQAAYQFGAYVYNNYRRSTNTGTAWSGIDFKKGTSASPIEFGSFINPFEYDNTNNIIYAGADAGEFFRWTTAQTTTASTYYSTTGFPTGAKIISGITALNNSKVTTLKASPYTSNRVYFGTAGGRIVYMNRADTATISSSGINITGTGMPTANVSCINIGTSDQYLIACYTNYSVTHIWVSINGGTSWTAIDGNLPDMPVRWCMFYPGLNTQAIIATETGVFTTDSINGSSTVWNASASFPAVRTDMLKYRSSDGTLVAATHGRGLWTTTVTTCTPVNLLASNNGPICTGQTLNISGTSDQASATYSWSGPNGFSSTSLSPSISNITSAAIGTYTLTATYNNCISSTSTTVSIISPAVITASNNGPLCQAQTLNLLGVSDQSTATYSWSGPNGFSSTSLTPSVTNTTTAATGTYTLTSMYSGCTSSTTTSAVINSATAPTISASSNSPLCTGQTLNITGTSNQPTATYSWSGPNGFSSTSLSSSITNSTTIATGTYILTATYSGCISTSSTTVTINEAGPLTTGTSICQGGSGSISSSSSCTGYANAGTTFSGTWNALTDPIAKRISSITNSGTCSFDATITRNYVSTSFQVSTTGSYTFEMNSNSSFDGMGYIVSGSFVPGNCSGGGTWIVGDDDGGSTNSEPLLTANLTAGVTYKLISTTWASSSGTYSGPFGWTITPPSGGQIMLYGTANLEWYTASSGGTAIGSGSPFNPVGVSGSGLSNTNSTGTTTYYAVCSNNSNGCRTATTFTINPPPSTPTATLTQPTCTVSTGSITVTSSLTGLSFSIDGSTYTNTTGIFNGLAAANYSLTAKNSSGCISSPVSLTISAQPTTPSVPTATLTQPTCTVSTGSITITSSLTGLSFSINGSTYTNTTGIFNGLAAANYSLTAKNSSGCISSPVSLTISAQPTTPSVPTATLTQPTCTVSTGSITITSSLTGLSFSINGSTYTNTTGFFNGLAAANYSLTAKNSSGCISSLTSLAINAQPTNCNTTLHVKVYLQGYYLTAGNQRATLSDLGLNNTNNETDSIQINLWSPSSLSNNNPNYSKETILHADGSATALFPASTLGKSFYIAVKHRSSIETWSKDSVTISIVTNYDFTNSENKAYGDGINPPMIHFNDGKYGIYSGDVNQDGGIDIIDMQGIENDASNFQYGYNSTDVNGDLGSDILDMQIVENNSGLFIYYARPY